MNRLTVCALALVTLVSTNRNAHAQTFEELVERIAALEAKLASLTVEDGVGEATELVFTGVNVHVRNGLGETDGVVDGIVSPSDVEGNGLGNLIVGYNEPSPDQGPDARSGSHNLVVGPEHEYSSVGGLVAGLFNTVSGPFSSVTGGDSNTASGSRSSVTGGFRNTAEGSRSSVTGGIANTAEGTASSVTGGIANTAEGTVSSVAGGEDNTAEGIQSSVIGGVLNAASGFSSSVSGGLRNTASGLRSSVSGGANKIAEGENSSL